MDSIYQLWSPPGICPGSFTFCYLYTLMTSTKQPSIVMSIILQMINLLCIVWQIIKKREININYDLKLLNIWLCTNKIWAFLNCAATHNHPYFYRHHLLPLTTRHNFTVTTNDKP